MEALLENLPVGTDTVLWDGTELNRKIYFRGSLQARKGVFGIFLYFPKPSTHRCSLT